LSGGSGELDSAGDLLAREASDQVKGHVDTGRHPRGGQHGAVLNPALPSTHERAGQGAVDHIASHLASDLTATAPAADAGVSGRHLTRLFIDHHGKAPGRFVRDARTEAAAPP
jgi:transcriptional regulator GlxA family with amidase domain